MGDVFARGSTVLDYWLVHAEGLVVEPIGARVEEVVVAAREGRADRLVVRSRLTHRRRSIDARAIAAVEPATGRLLLEPEQRRRRVDSAAERIRPHAARAASETARACRVAGTHTAAGLRWLAPRVVAATRTAAATAGTLMVAGAILAARAAGHAARYLDGVAERRRRRAT
ncbi:MAG TPA: hypothetical protein VI408_15030 [Gaiellaceae bacterium]